MTSRELSALIPDAKLHGEWYQALCPGHDDQRQSLSFRDGDRGVIVKCHAGCTVEQIAAALGIRVADLFYDNGAATAKRIVATYPYVDEHGQLLYEVIRYAPKSFKQRQPDGADGWLWNLNGIRRVLYRLPELHGHATLFLVEGEKDADRLWSLGLPATTNSGGAGKWTDDYTRQLAAAGVRDVLILPDNDVPGDQHAQQVAQSCHAAGLNVRIITLPGLPPRQKKHGQDISDWLDGGRTVQDLQAAMVAAPAWRPETPTPATAPPVVDPPHLTDVGNAKRLVAAHGTDLRYCAALGWLVWDGRRWAKDAGAAMRLAKDTALSMYAEAATLLDPERRKALAAHAMRSEAEPRLRAMLSLAASDAGIQITPEQLDDDPWSLTCQNGTLDLRTGTLHAHRRSALLSKITPIAYDQSAPCPRFQQFLARIFAGDEPVIRFLQKAVGYSLTGDTSEQVMFLLYGTGANGKTTLLKVLMAMLGEYALMTPTDTLLVRRGDSIPNDLARLAGARFVAAVESDGGRRLAEALVKQLTGGDTVCARFLHREFFEFTPQCKLFLAVNHKPRVTGTDHALWRRVRLVPFTIRIPDHEQDRHLVEKLKDEIPGVLRWAVEGCLDWQAHGLGLPEGVRKATAEYRQEQDIVRDFISERCVVEASATETVKDLYTNYVDWCEKSGEKAMTKKGFGMALAERGFEADRTREGRGWRGVRLRLLTDPDEPPAAEPEPVTAADHNETTTQEEIDLAS
jgi:putative DNA primase/helicase